MRPFGMPEPVEPDRYFSEICKSQNESVHSSLFALHDHIYRRALTEISKALIVLHKLEVSNQDARSSCQRYIRELEEYRNTLEGLGSRASAFRTEMIRANGCDGSCASPKESRTNA